MSFVFSIRNRERSKVKKGSKNYSLLPQKENGRNTILEVNVRYIKEDDLDHVFSKIQYIDQITIDIQVVKTYITYDLHFCS